MSTAPTRVFAARLAGLPVFDPQGDQVGKVRDVVVVLRADVRQPRVVGLVVEVFGRRQVFAPMTRVTNIDSGQVITTGLLNMRRFELRTTETLVIGQMLDRQVTVKSTGVVGVVYDVAMEQARTRDWVLSRVALQEPTKGFRRRSQTHVVEWDDVEGLHQRQANQGATHLIASLTDLKPADAANVIQALPPERRTEVVAAMDDERLAEVLEELPEEDQVEILEHLDRERAADVLEEMSPDDAADLIADLPPETARHLLELMEPEEAEDVRRLMSYGEQTAGGMMTPEPVILSPDATVAEALARVRAEDLTPSLAALVYVCRPPLETPTGKLLGIAHIQRLLREPPSELVAGILDTGVDYLHADATLEDVAIFLATYNLVAAPVVDDEGRLLGTVTVDDLLDHLLPEGWRDRKIGRG
ncbi:Mg/Co/Ni transporter MgtE [Marmoricola sp. OAE513]|uniref:magnesium transporter MgtE N-terminal domain-containing protein n=1 Tax=Marmoricola sp. OAE513 TaxID=2817894 RepID=UPI001AE3AEA4